MSFQTFEEQITFEMRTIIHFNENKNENILETINNQRVTIRNEYKV
jgi:hypothetical protein